MATSHAATSNDMADIPGMAFALADSWHKPFVTRDHVAEKKAFVKLARGRNRRAVTYRRWAQESEQAGRLEDYRRYTAEAERQRKGALNALSFARLEAAYMEARNG